MLLLNVEGKEVIVEVESGSEGIKAPEAGPHDKGSKGVYRIQVK